MSHEALALFEIDGLPRAIACQDAALKQAPIEIVACAPISPGKAILIFAGDVASVEESRALVLRLAGSRLLDAMVLPGVHETVVQALLGERRPRAGEVLAILELKSIAASIEAADRAVKSAAVHIGRLHLAAGFGGRGYFTLLGRQADVEAAVEAALAIAGERALDHEIIANPHRDLDAAAFRRPWPLDPAD